MGLVPLLANLSYNFSMSLARNSGGRYLLAVDWITYVYAAIGLMEIAIAILSVLGLPNRRLAPVLVSREAEDPAVKPGFRWNWRAGAGTVLALLLLGSLPPLAERIASPRYPTQPEEDLVREVVAHPFTAQSGLDAPALHQFLEQPGALIFKGRALYPRYYAAGDGEPRTAKIGYRPLEYSRTVFQVTSPRFNGAAVLKSEKIPGFFPNASDVLLVGCAAGTSLEPALVLVLDAPGGGYLADSGLETDCAAVEVDPE